MSELRIRRAVPDDLDAVVEVGRTTWPATYGPIAGDDYVTMGLAKWWTREETLPLVYSGRTTVAEEVGESGERHIEGIASTGLLKGHLVLFRLYVLPDHQGQGIGQLLLEDVVAQATLAGHPDIRLSYLDGNEGAARFYAAAGFTELHREHSGHGIPDSVWVVRELSQETS